MLVKLKALNESEEVIGVSDSHLIWNSQHLSIEVRGHRPTFLIDYPWPITARKKGRAVSVELWYLDNDTELSGAWRKWLTVPMRRAVYLRKGETVFVEDIAIQCT